MRVHVPSHKTCKDCENNDGCGHFLPLKMNENAKSIGQTTNKIVISYHVIGLRPVSPKIPPKKAEAATVSTNLAKPSRCSFVEFMAVSFLFDRVGLRARSLLKHVR